MFGFVHYGQWAGISAGVHDCDAEGYTIRCFYRKNHAHQEFDHTGVTLKDVGDVISALKA